MYGGALRVVVSALFPGLWAAPYQSAIGLAVAWLVLRYHAGDRLDRRQLFEPAAYVGVGGAIVFAIAGLMPSGVSMLSAMVAACVTWIGASLLVERHLDLDIERAQPIVAAILPATWLSWLIVGAIIHVVRAV